MRERPPTKTRSRAGARRRALPGSGPITGLALALATALAGGPAAAVPPTVEGCDLVPVADTTQAVVTTPLGSMRIELYSNVTPLTVANFLAYIDSDAYAGTVVHRVAAQNDGTPFVIQMGGYRAAGTTFESIERDDPVPNEPCLSNVRGTVAMAKADNAPDSATSEWFVNLDDGNVFLDGQNGGFTVFGEVIEGMDVADAIFDLPGRPTGLLVPYLSDAPIQVRAIFRESPLASPIVEPGVVGCFDVDQSGVVMAQDPQSLSDLEPEAATGASFTIVSTACLGAGTDGTPPFECAEPGRRVLHIDPTNGSLVPDGSAPFGFAETTLGCADLAASEAARQQRLQAVDVAGSLVQTSYALAPEPAAPLLAGAALLCLAGLRRAARRPRHRRR